MSPTIFRESGFSFFSREEKRPHVHVNGSDGEAKFWLEPDVILATNYGLSDPELAKIKKIIEEHKDEFISAWDSCFRH